MRSLVAVVGATGTGKSKLAVDIATRFNGEIINGDAMQMYRGLPIITNQIPIEERNGIPHHMISCIDLDEAPWRISMFRRECLRLIDDIHARGKLPVLVGGTHYYTQSVLFQDQLVIKDDGSLGEEHNINMVDVAEPSVKWPILDAEPEVVLQKLREVDPIMAKRWHPKDTRKIRRSLEIYFQTGKPASQVYVEQRQLKQAAGEKAGPDSGTEQLRFNTIMFWVDAERHVLGERLFKRVDDMVDQGLLSEASRMADYLHEKEAQGITVDQTRGVWISIGFKELSPYFEALRDGSKTQKELDAVKASCVELVKVATRQYAMTQLSWIRNKLWNKLAQAGMTNRLYLLDTTDVETWPQNVMEPSERLVEALLNGGTLPDPKSLSELARTTLRVYEAKLQPVDPGIVRTITCDVCHKTLANEEQWQLHIKGRGHRRVMQRRAQRQARDEYLQKRRESQENAQDEAIAETKELDSQTSPDGVMEK
ncbi:IPP transferase-domain-containing protein [Aspergillus venezuelensis]